MKQEKVNSTENKMKQVNEKNTQENLYGKKTEKKKM